MASITIQTEEEPLPSHWEKRTDKITGLPFFLNQSDQTTTWDDPRANTQPRSMLNSRFAGSSPRINRKIARDPIFESFGDDHGFLNTSFHQSTLPRNRIGGFGSRFIDMDQFFHPRDERDEVEQPAPQPQWATLDRRRTKPRKVQPQNSDSNVAPDYDSLPRFRRQRFSEPPSTERLYGKPNAADFQIPVRFEDENRQFNRSEDEEERQRPCNRLFVKLRQKPNQMPTQEEVMSPDQNIEEPTCPTYREQREPMRPEYNEPTRPTRRVYEPEPTGPKYNEPRQPTRRVYEPELNRPKFNEPTQHTRRVHEPEPTSPMQNEPTDQAEVQEETIQPSSKSPAADDRQTCLHMTSERTPSPMESTPASAAPEDTTQTKTNDPTKLAAEPELNQTEDNEVEQKQTAIDAALAKIAEVRKRVDSYKLDIANFTGDAKSKEFRYLIEMLTRATLDLDMVDSQGETIIRTKRKETIKYIDLCTEQLESKCQVPTN